MNVFCVLLVHSFGHCLSLWNSTLFFRGNIWCEISLIWNYVKWQVFEVMFLLLLYISHLLVVPLFMNQCYSDDIMHTRTFSDGYLHLRWNNNLQHIAPSVNCFSYQCLLFQQYPPFHSHNTCFAFQNVSKYFNGALIPFRKCYEEASQPCQQSIIRRLKNDLGQNCPKQACLEYRGALEAPAPFLKGSKNYLYFQKIPPRRANCCSILVGFHWCFQSTVLSQTTSLLLLSFLSYLMTRKDCRKWHISMEVFWSSTNCTLHSWAENHQLT